MKAYTGFLHVLTMMIRKDFLGVIRYPSEFISMVFIMAFYAIGIAWGISFVVPMGCNFILAYCIFLLYQGQFAAIFYYVQEGALSGTLLKELSCSTHIFVLTLTYSTSNAIFTIIRVIVTFLLAALFGFVFEFDLLLTFSVILISLLFFFGLSYFFGSLAVLFKDTDSIFSFVSWTLMILGVYATSPNLPGWVADIFRWFPYTQIAIILTRTGIGGEGLAQVSPELLPLAVSSAAFLLLGLFVFNIAFNTARLRGNLGHY